MVTPVYPSNGHTRRCTGLSSGVGWLRIGVPQTLSCWGTSSCAVNVGLRQLSPTYVLKASLEEAVAIKQQRQPAARVTRYEVADVKAIRAALNVSQQEMAEALGTSVDTIKSWESRRRNPTGLAAKVLATIADNPSLFRELAAH